MWDRRGVSPRNVGASDVVPRKGGTGDVVMEKVGPSLLFPRFYGSRKRDGPTFFAFACSGGGDGPTF